MGSTLTTDQPLFFRNLDGVGTMRAEIIPTALKYIGEDPDTDDAKVIEKAEAALMTARTARACAEVRAAEAQTPGGLSQWRALLLHLLVERRKGAASFWG